MITARVALEERKVTKRQKSKFGCLQGGIKEQAPPWMGKTVVNLSSKILNLAIERVLAKGHNYAIAPR